MKEQKFNQEDIKSNNDGCYTRRNQCFNAEEPKKTIDAGMFGFGIMQKRNVDDKQRNRNTERIGHIEKKAAKIALPIADQIVEKIYARKYNADCCTGNKHIGFNNYFHFLGGKRIKYTEDKKAS